MATTFETRIPELHELQKFVSYYYFHSSDEDTNKLSFSYYPHFKNAVTLYQDSKVNLITPTHSNVTPEPGSFICAYAQMFTQFAKTKIHGKFQKIGIVFEPLGLNHFLDRPLSEIIHFELNCEFDYFEQKIAPFRQHLFSASIDEKVRLLDDFLFSNLQQLEVDKLKSAITILFDDKNKNSIESVANELGISRKTLLRMFRKHLNYSVQNYASLIQFRKAVEVYQEAAEKPSFTGLALDLNYYDQSDFIRNFKRITKTNPTRFFKQLKKFGDNQTFWTPD